MISIDINLRAPDIDKSGICIAKFQSASLVTAYALLKFKFGECMRMLYAYVRMRMPVCSCLQ